MEHASLPRCVCRTDESISQRYQELVTELLPDPEEEIESLSAESEPAAQEAARKHSYAVPLDLGEYEVRW